MQLQERKDDFFKLLSYIFKARQSANISLNQNHLLDLETYLNFKLCSVLVIKTTERGKPVTTNFPGENKINCTSNKIFVEKYWVQTQSQRWNYLFLKGNTHEKTFLEDN